MIHEVAAQYQRQIQSLSMIINPHMEWFDWNLIYGRIKQKKMKLWTNLIIYFFYRPVYLLHRSFFIGSNNYLDFSDWHLVSSVKERKCERWTPVEHHNKKMWPTQRHLPSRICRPAPAQFAEISRQPNIRSEIFTEEATRFPWLASPGRSRYPVE